MKGCLTGVENSLWEGPEYKPSQQTQWSVLGSRREKFLRGLDIWSNTQSSSTVKPDSLGNKMASR